MGPDVDWLSPQEERLWRAWVGLHARLTDALQRDLQADAGLSMPDLEVLVHLTDDPAGRLRVGDLATLLVWERSRVSHHVRRMEGRGLVERVRCPQDRRGSFVAVTADGRRTIERASPGHVHAVRRLVFDRLSEADVVVLQALMDKLTDEG